jgi:hypothetical protein
LPLLAPPARTKRRHSRAQTAVESLALPEEPFPPSSPPRHRGETVAVGTPVTRRPPHGSVLEELPHTALAADTNDEASCLAPIGHPKDRQIPTLSPEAVERPMVSLADGLPSMPSADGLLPTFVRALRQYYAIVRLPSHVHVGRTAQGLRQPARPLPATGVTGVSRFSRLEFPPMLRVSDPAGPRIDFSLSPIPV